jgi:crotonobetainyl-CoA:carnitine CoA-transferase CaiB-like acyl-CoA transferase
MTGSARPLDGVTVVALEHAVAAPLASRHLADLGARVVKVERPDGGDFARSYDHTVAGMSSFFVWLNRSKESVALDLKHPEARAIFEELLGRADVLLHNLSADGARRLGVAPDQVLERHPRVVAAAVSGFGDTGPLAGRKAYDLLIQAEAGLLEITGTAQQRAKVGVSIADIAAGMYAYSGILAALFERTRTGRGAVVPVVMLDVLAEWMSAPLYFAHYGGAAPPRVGARHATIAPYGPFTTADGATIMIGVQNDREWARFAADVLEDPGLVDGAFATNAARVAHVEELQAVVSGCFERLSVAAVMERLDRAGIAYGSLNDLDAVWEHPQLRARDRFVEVGSEVGTLTTLRPPTDDGSVTHGPVPGLGEHTDAVLAELGIDRGTRDRLRQSGVIR